VTSLLWIDAICINQEDLQERIHQVRMMDLIYRFARRVRVLMGQSTEGTSIALQLLHDVTARYSEQKKEVENGRRDYSRRYFGSLGTDEALSEFYRQEKFRLNSDDLFFLAGHKGDSVLNSAESLPVQRERWTALAMLYSEVTGPEFGSCKNTYLLARSQSIVVRRLLMATI
jgi:hypothetical protein